MKEYNKMGYSTITKGTQTYQKRERKIITSTAIEVETQLKQAVREGRVPTSSELLDECRAILGSILIGLRHPSDVFKSATAIAQIVKAISQVSALERVEEISEMALKNMTEQELKEYASRLIDKLAA
jgi:hypothetical protein